MIKITKPKQEAQYELFCDITGKKLCFGKKFKKKDESILGCTIRFNNNYGAPMDYIAPLDIHLSDEITLEFIKWLREKYPQSPFIQELLQKEYFNDTGRLSTTSMVS